MQYSSSYMYFGLPCAVVRPHSILSSSPHIRALGTVRHSRSPLASLNQGKSAKWWESSSSSNKSKHNDGHNKSKNDHRHSSSKRIPDQSTWATIDASSLKYEPVQPPRIVPVAELRHGLDRVLFNPGVHFLRDPRTGVYNFDPYLQHIVQPEQVNFDSFPPYITASQDPSLINLAKENNARFISSTSSISGALSHMYFMISGGRPLDISRLSHDFQGEPANFTKTTRSPTSVILKRHKGSDVYSIDADKSYDSDETILSKLGKSMEHMLTTTREEFADRHLLNPNDESHFKRDCPHEAYAYGRAGAFLLRAQLDCYDSRLPRGTFDLKTRATVAIRLDADNYEHNTGYHILYSHGLYASYEREYYDMLRSAFLKYSLQVRIGHMDGILVAFHNTQRVFGFQYISLEEMDSSLFGSSTAGDSAFVMSLRLLEDLMQRAVDAHPTANQLRVTFDTNEHGDDLVYVEELADSADPNVMSLRKVDPLSAKEGHVLPLSRFRIYNTSLVNGKPVSERSYFKINKGDKWSVKYAISHQTRSEQIAFDYFAVRRSQDLRFRKRELQRQQAIVQDAAKADDATSPTPHKSYPITPVRAEDYKPKGMMAVLRKYYVKEVSKRMVKKIMYRPRHPVDVPMDSLGEVCTKGNGYTHALHRDDGPAKASTTAD